MARNSWGTNWGENGLFRIIRGVNSLGIESDCSWATPKDTWSKPSLHVTTEEEKNDPRNSKYTLNSNPQKSFLGGEERQTCRRLKDDQLLTTQKLPSSYLSW